MTAGCMSFFQGQRALAHMHLLAKSETPVSATPRVPINFTALDHELAHRHATLRLLWEEYSQSHARQT